MGHPSPARLRLLLPILGHALNSPEVSGFLEGKSQEPDPFKLSERDAVDDTGGDLDVGGKTQQANDGARRHRTAGADGASSKIREDDITRLGERIARIEAGECDRNLARDASASALY